MEDDMILDENMQEEEIIDDNDVDLTDTDENDDSEELDNDVELEEEDNVTNDEDEDKHSDEDVEVPETVDLVSLFKGAKPVQQPTGDVVQPQTPANSNDPVEVIKQYIQDSIRAAVSPFQQETEDMRIVSEVARLTATYKDFKDYAPKAVEVLKSDPELYGTKNPMEKAYMIAKAMSADTAIKTAKQQGKNEAYDSKVKKKAAFAEGTTGKRQGTKSKSAGDSIIEDIMSVAKPRI